MSVLAIAALGITAMIVIAQLIPSRQGAGLVWQAFRMTLLVIAVKEFGFPVVPLISDMIQAIPTIQW